MLKKVPFIATAALVLSVCTALALPPAPPVSGATPAGLPPGIELLPDAEMTDLVGAGWRSAICHASRLMLGSLVSNVGRALRDGLLVEAGNQIVRLAAYCY